MDAAPSNVALDFLIRKLTDACASGLSAQIRANTGLTWDITILAKHRDGTELAVSQPPEGDVIELLKRAVALFEDKQRL